MKVRMIRCATCLSLGRVKGDIPERCPNCGQRFRELPREESIIDVLYNIFIKKKRTRGYFEVDAHGWAKGTDDIIFPHEKETI
jgi:hypothetical protein